MTATSSFGEIRKGVFPSMQKHTFADPTTQPFWDAARVGRLIVPCCTRCGTFRLPPYPICYACQSFDLEWVELTGLGTVYSYTVVHHPLHPDLVDAVPYLSAIVELDGTQGEGARMLANVIDCEPGEISIGSRVRIIFEHVNDDMSTPRFRLVRGDEK